MPSQIAINRTRGAWAAAISEIPNSNYHTWPELTSRPSPAGCYFGNSHTSAVAWFVPVIKYLPSGVNAAHVAPPSGHVNVARARPVAQSSTTMAAGRPNEDELKSASDLPSGLNTGADTYESMPVNNCVVLPVSMSKCTSLPFDVMTAAEALSPAVATTPLLYMASSR